MSIKLPIIIALFSKVMYEVKNDKKEKNDCITKMGNDNPNGDSPDEQSKPQKERETPSNETPLNKSNIQYPQYINLRDLYQRFLTEWKNRIERSFSILVLSFELNIAINFIHILVYIATKNLNLKLPIIYYITIFLIIAIMIFIEIMSYKKYKKLNESFRMIEKEIIAESSKIECLNEDTAYQTLKKKCINTPQSFKYIYGYIIIIAFSIVNLSIIVSIIFDVLKTISPS